MNHIFWWLSNIRGNLKHTDNDAGPTDERSASYKGVVLNGNTETGNRRHGFMDMGKGVINDDKEIRKERATGWDVRSGGERRNRHHDRSGSSGNRLFRNLAMGEVRGSRVRYNPLNRNERRGNTSASYRPVLPIGTSNLAPVMELMTEEIAHAEMVIEEPEDAMDVMNEILTATEVLEEGENVTSTEDVVGVEQTGAGESELLASDVGIEEEEQKNNGLQSLVVEAPPAVPLVKKQGAHKKLFKPAALAVGGASKKRMVQAILSPRKRAIPKGPTKVIEKESLPEIPDLEAKDTSSSAAPHDIFMIFYYTSIWFCVSFGYGSDGFVVFWFLWLPLRSLSSFLEFRSCLVSGSVGLLLSGGWHFDTVLFKLSSVYFVFSVLIKRYYGSYGVTGTLFFNYIRMLSSQCWRGGYLIYTFDLRLLFNFANMAVAVPISQLGYRCLDQKETGYVALSRED